MLRVGLTGGIACGKSTIAAMLVKRGAHLLQADGLAHQLYAPGSNTYDAVVRAFGSDILNDDGSINRTRLANAVFPDRIGELNAVVHPAVIEAQSRWMREIEQKDPHGIAVVEAALLIEAGAAADFDKVIVVTCDLEHKIDHYAKRMGITPEAARAEVERRSAAQFTDQQKAEHADYIIDNSGSMADAERQVERIWEELTNSRKQAPQP